jgi:hypothetical protein
MKLKGSLDETPDFYQPGINRNSEIEYPVLTGLPTSCNLSSFVAAS